MTKDEILNATPEQLRVWIAIEVMGFTNVESRAADEDLWGEPSGWKGDPEMVIAQPLPDYPSDITAAWQVWRWACDHLAKERGGWGGFLLFLKVAASHRKYGAWQPYFRLERALWEMDPEIICKAALLAVLEEEL